MTALPLPTRAGVLAAAERLRGSIVRTPLLAAGGDRPLWVKPECLQRTGSFKIRGATNFIGLLSAAERNRGVVAYSSGNHAQGVAAAAADHGVAATIVMPEDAPPIKLRNTRRLGATVITYDRATGDREQIAAEVASETGAIIVPPYDHPTTIEGQGTVGLEILEDLVALGMETAAVVVPAGGGGLTAGIALAITDRTPPVSVYTAEPAVHDDHRRSFEAGERVTVVPDQPSICDALQAPTPGALPFSISQERVAGGVTATDEQVLEAMRWAFEELHLVVEPGGAVGLAAYLSGVVPGEEPVVAVLSGGNVDAAMMRRALT